MADQSTLDDILRRIRLLENAQQGPQKNRRTMLLNREAWVQDPVDEASKHTVIIEKQKEDGLWSFKYADNAVGAWDRKPY